MISQSQPKLFGIFLQVEGLHQARLSLRFRLHCAHQLLRRRGQDGEHGHAAARGTRCVAATPWPPWAMTTSSSASLWGAAVVWMGRVELVGWVLCRESPIKLVIEDILWWNFVTDSKHHPGGPAAIDPDLPTNSSDVLLGPCPRWWLVQQHGECRSSHRGIYTTWRISPFHPRRQEFLGRELGWQGLLLHALCLHHRSSTGPGQWLQVGQPCSIHRSL